jgi:hypothetical protein
VIVTQVERHQSEKLTKTKHGPKMGTETRPIGLGAGFDFVTLAGEPRTLENRSHLEMTMANGRLCEIQAGIYRIWGEAKPKLPKNFN